MNFKSTLSYLRKRIFSVVSSNNAITPSHYQPIGNGRFIDRSWISHMNVYGVHERCITVSGSWCVRQYLESISWVTRRGNWTRCGLLSDVVIVERIGFNQIVRLIARLSSELDICWWERTTLSYEPLLAFTSIYIQKSGVPNIPNMFEQHEHGPCLQSRTSPAEKRKKNYIFVTRMRIRLSGSSSFRP